MKLLPVLFIVVIIKCHLVLTVKILEDSPGKHVKKKEGLAHKILKRQVSCNDEGEYLVKDHCCTKCKAGSYVESDCASPSGNPICKTCTEGVDYTEMPNGYPECLKCQDCEPSSGREVLQNCTVTQNTMCRCREGFFCEDSSPSSDGTCSLCQHCQQCDHGYAEPCSSTKNAVCNSQRNHLWAIGVAVVLIAGILIAVYIIKRKKPTPKPTPDEIILPFVPPNDPNPSPAPAELTCPTRLEDIPLENHLSDFSEIMDTKTVLKLARRDLPQTDVEDIQQANRDDYNEQRYRLLQKWYTCHGRTKAFKHLFEQSPNLTREKLIKLVARNPPAVA